MTLNEAIQSSRDAQETIRVLKADNERLRAQLEQLQVEAEASGGIPDHLAELVKAKRLAGLSKDMAIEVARKQFELDEAERFEAKAKEPAKPTPAKVK